jgi:circadian clock protein KaiC
MKSRAAGCRRAGRRSSAGGPGSGKTLLALTFLVNGTIQFNEPGVLMTFEENAEEIASDVASLGFDLPELIKA